MECLQVQQYSQKTVKLEKVHNYNTRPNQKNDIFIKRVRTMFAQKSILFLVSKFRNKLPNDLKQLPYHKFKKALKCSMIEKY